MNRKALKYLFVLTPLCVWFYFGCASSRPAVTGDGSDDPRIEEVAQRVAARDTARQPAQEPTQAQEPVREVVGETVGETAQLPERESAQQATDTVKPADVASILPPVQRDTTAAETLPAPESTTATTDTNTVAEEPQPQKPDSASRLALTRERAHHMLDSISRREWAVQELRRRLEQANTDARNKLGMDVSEEEILEMASDALAPVVDSLRTFGIELPKADRRPGHDSNIMNRIGTMISSEMEGTRTTRMAVLAADTIASDIAAFPELDTLPRVKPPRKDFLEDPIFSKNKDSMIYDVRGNAIYLFKGADIDYQNMNLKGEYIRLDTENKELFTRALTVDSSYVRPAFTQGAQEVFADTIIYNLSTKKSFIYGIQTQEGEGNMLGEKVKMHPDGHFDMAGGKYTTCSHVDCPHFYISMNRGKVIPNNKVIFGMAHFVLEDVPLYFPFVPFGFFPLASGPSSGFIMPSFGEEYEKGFFMRDGGYYFRFSDYMDATLTGSLYTLGSWDAKATSRYLRRYKYSGTFDLRYSKNIVGEKNSKDYVNSGTFVFNWSHSQDPKFKPNSTFSASVNFSTSGNKRYGSTTVQEYLQTQTSSSISYSRNFPSSERFPGGNVSVAFRHSQSMSDSTISFSFPEAAWNIQKFKPFKRKNPVGKERWYEKISLNYSGGLKGSLDNIKEKDLFTSGTLDKLKTGVEHKIPVSISFNLLNYINLTGSGNYTERWFFKKVNKHWDEMNKEVVSDTTSGFYRVYDYGVSASLSTKLYGMYQIKNPDGFLKAVRHVVTPSVSFSLKPDFGDPKYGFWKTYQSSEDGSTTTYSPYSGINHYSPPGRGESASMSFSLQQNLEAKIKSDRDTTGMRKIVLIENLSLSSGYNFLADSMNLSPINFTLVIPIVQNFKLNLSGVLEPYMFDKTTGKSYNKLMIAKGKPGRISRVGTSFSWQWQKTIGSEESIEQYNRQVAAMPHSHDPDDQLDLEAMRQMMAAAYYDFSVPFNFGFSYQMSYTNNGMRKILNHSVNFNASLTLTPFKADGQNRWAINVNTFGYDFTNRKLTPGTVGIVRDLHCFTMSLNWTPLGYIRSWSFNIRIKADVLKDLKYDKRRSYYDTLGD